MSYKKKFLNKSGTSSPISGINSNSGAWNNTPTGGWNNDEFGYKNYASRLPEVYTGHPNRIERYNQYMAMDTDAEINACLDIIAEFSTQRNEHNKTPFSFEFKEEPTPREVELLTKQLQQWCKLNEFDVRMFKIFRNTIMYGDQVFVRDPENFKLYWVDMVKVTKVIVNESEGKRPEQYVIKDININLQNLTVAQKTNTDFAANPATGMGGTGGGANTSYTVPSMPYNTTGSRFTLGQSESAVDADHIIHVSLTEGLDRFWPFGQSILENIFKVYKQKELLEDAILIYRVQRAPERRVFKIDVGNMPSHMAMAFVERVKNEIHQRRIPSLHGGQSMVDAAYSPLSINEDYYFPVTSEGRGSSVEVLPGGCLAMDTKVSLLDGRELTIREIENEISDGKELWTYSCDPKTGKIVPGLVTWAGVTQKTAKVIKITLDNGEYIIATPDHKFPMYHEEFRRADELSIGDSLIPLYRRHEILHGKRDYEQYFDNEQKEWIYTHRMVANELRDVIVEYIVNNPDYSNGLYEVCHHKNFDRFNNDPNNLCWMSSKDHFKYHSALTAMKYESLRENNPREYEELITRIGQGVKRYWDNKTPEERQFASIQIQKRWESYSDEQYDAICKKMSDSMKKYIASLSEDDRSNRAEIGRKSLKKAKHRFDELMKNDPDFYKMVVEKRMEYWTEENRSIRAELIREWNFVNWNTEAGTQRRKKMSSSQQIDFTHDMLKFVIDMVKGKTSHQVTAADVAKALNESPLKQVLYELNQGKIIRNWKPEDGFTEGNIRRGLVTRFGYKNWKDFRIKESMHNHVVVSIEYLDDPIEVGTLTIDGDELFHDYHTFALSCGVMTKNSNLNEIDDLRYFNNKLARGLRVPSSYLPTGPDDNTTPLSDGRVGTAMIQEFRFNQYCERLQNYIALKFDEEFKLFLRWRGLNIDTALFNLAFNPPQNFAAYRQSELDNARVGTFTSMESLPYISKRFALERFLGLSEEEIKKNEKLWEEENKEDLSSNTSGSDLRNVGITAGNFEADLNTADEIAAGEMPPEESPDMAGPVGAPEAGGVSAPGGSPGGPMQI